MEQLLFSFVLIVVLFVLLAGGVWVALSLLAVAWVAMDLFTSAPIGKVLATSVWGTVAVWPMTALPLFVWMGEILFRTRLASDMFRGLAPWLSRLPGRLMHVNVAACGIFAAVCGSSAATAATIGQLTLPELERRGYDRTVSIGSLAASGSLGMMIPPSIVMIVYGLAADVSIARLFIAGVMPGLLLMLLFMGYIAFWSIFNPGKTPPAESILAFRDRVRATGGLIPVLLLIVFVIGSIYTGLATPTEAAAVGVIGSLALSFATGSLTWNNFSESLIGAMQTSCMVVLIVATASFLSVAMGYTGLPADLGQWISDLGLPPFALIAVLTVFYIILGCFLDGISMIVLTAAVVLPTVEKVGIDLLWFGIYVVLVVEMSQVTPPVGFNLFVVQGLTGENILRVARAALPFFGMMIVAVVIITAFPDVVTFLPKTMANR